jgi:glycosyltransferase involved in cell wall biosynthesis
LFSMTSTVKVSVIIPIKGRPQLFALTAQSLAEQTYPHWEALVVDDGSSADEFRRIAEIAGRDQRMRLMKTPALGVERRRAAMPDWLPVAGSTLFFWMATMRWRQLACNAVSR